MKEFCRPFAARFGWCVVTRWEREIVKSKVKSKVIFMSVVGTNADPSDAICF
jgi:hypothetical protein